MLVGFEDGLGGQEAPVLAEGTEQDAVEELLRAGEHLVWADGRVRPAKVIEGVFPHVGVADVELLGQLAADLLRGIQQLVEVALARGRHDPLGTEEEEEPPELAPRPWRGRRCRTARRCTGPTPCDRAGSAAST